MSYGPKGQPRFAQASTSDQPVPEDGCSDGWDNRFSYPGANSYVYAVASDAAGNLYVGGSFTVIGDVVTTGIAKWNGSSWSALGSGVASGGSLAPFVYAIAVSGTDVYIGGDFAGVGGVEAWGIAKWNGTNWSPLGNGFINGEVWAIAVNGTNVYAGGDFNSAGGVPANSIAKWDGTQWSALGSGTQINSTVYAVATVGADVYIGGDFSTVGGMSIPVIARWNGTSWSALGTGVNGYVLSMAVSGTELYVGGLFTTAGGMPANHIAKWNGINWSTLGQGVEGSQNPVVLAITVAGSDVYAGGSFTDAGGSKAHNIAKWDGANWSPLGTGVGDPIEGFVDGNVESIGVAGGTVFAGGNFAGAGDIQSQDIAKWDGNNWSTPKSGMGVGFASVRAVAVTGSDVYVGGYLRTAGDLTVKGGIAKWNGNNWSVLGSGLGSSARVDDIAVSGTDVYAAGAFTISSGAPADYLAKWNGTTWSAVGTGVGGYVGAVAVSGNTVYAAGRLTSAGGVPVNGLAKWDGSSWSSLGSSGVSGGFNHTVYDIQIADNNDVYLAGDFSGVNGVPANGIAKWNGSSWSALGSGAGGPFAWPSVHAIAIRGSNVYAGGNFGTMGGVSANCIARWDGANWFPLGSGLSSSFTTSVSAIAVSGATDIYAGGAFTGAGGHQARYIAKWNGTDWSSLGTGMDSYVSTIAVTSTGTDVYAGGDFLTAGGNVSSYFGHFTASGPVSTPSATPTPVGTLCPTFSETFDGVTAPSLPAGWIATNASGADPRWVTSNTSPDSPPNSAFINDAGSVTDKRLESPPILINSASAQLRFRNSFNTEASGGDYYDGGVLEISSPNINCGAFTDVTGPSAGGSFVLGGYTGTIDLDANPLAGRMAWSGNSGGYIDTVINLGPKVVGQQIKLRFRMGTDASKPSVGWRIDSLLVSDSCEMGSPTPTATNTPIATDTPTSTPTATPGGPSISGTITYGNAIGAPAPRFVSNVLLSGSGSLNVSTMSAFPGGTYSLGGFGAGSYTVTPTKTTGLNSITSFDAAKISQHAAGVSSLTGNQLIVADVSGNGSISSFDAGQVARFVVSAPPYGATGNWTFSPVNRTYPSITTNISGQDYSALLMGEVSGNWTNTGARPLDVRQSPAGEEEGAIDSDSGPGRSLAVDLPHFVTLEENEVVVPVIVEGTADQGIISYEFNLRYDPSVIQPHTNPVDLAGTISSKLSVAFNADEAGLLRVAVYGPVPIDGSGILFNLKFTAVGAPGSVSPLIWEGFMLNDYGTVDGGLPYR